MSQKYKYSDITLKLMVLIYYLFSLLYVFINIDLKYILDTKVIGFVLINLFLFNQIVIKKSFNKTYRDVVYGFLNTLILTIFAMMFFAMCLKFFIHIVYLKYVLFNFLLLQMILIVSYYLIINKSYIKGYLTFIFLFSIFIIYTLNQIYNYDNVIYLSLFLSTIILIVSINLIGYKYLRFYLIHKNRLMYQILFYYNQLMNGKQATQTTNELWKDIFIFSYKKHIENKYYIYLDNLVKNNIYFYIDLLSHSITFIKYLSLHHPQDTFF
ncbi:hypothetical protein DEFDS_P082 (plasmid) [Deferribacter desulfuricans SSM1]|uniref:Uncharacterized protein n=1 Tax=Deferribacter desulfuricans (strain DSM 14783 / JCM 11476 / NBRC 101012 / SSM1) TaxID=639282 RepID=D3PER4_DEFDS|nr:hypothetical protein [Deferribacter desulfuricans]BAI81706.1 hypothetical protein DEFDS_P082 [Deferribacter desulfuricans SSM1]